MAIKQTVTESAFLAAFERDGYRNSFSRDGLRALYEHLWELSDEMGYDIEMDVPSLCGEFAELTFEEAQRDYGDADDYPQEDDPDEVVDWFCERTSVVEFTRFDFLTGTDTPCIIIAAF